MKSASKDQIRIKVNKTLYRRLLSKYTHKSAVCRIVFKRFMRRKKMLMPDEADYLTQRFHAILGRTIFNLHDSVYVYYEPEHPLSYMRIWKYPNWWFTKKVLQSRILTMVEITKIELRAQKKQHQGGVSWDS